MKPEKTMPILLGEFIGAVKEAAQCAWQMIHIQKDMRWAILRETLEQVSEISAAIAVGKIR